MWWDTIRRIQEISWEKEELPFELSEQETELAESNESLFILGRSGTGKVCQLFHCLELNYHTDNGSIA
jgi:alpha-D-ribose 1-methylphosphonate 5-triphosphate synthase subunit PhnL